jgi:hypothetical protein
LIERGGDEKVEEHKERERERVEYGWITATASFGLLLVL